MSHEFLLDATLNGIGGAQSAAMMVCLREHSQSIRHTIFKPFNETMGLLTMALEQKSRIFWLGVWLHMLQRSIEPAIQEWKLADGIEYFRLVPRTDIYT